MTRSSKYSAIAGEALGTCFLVMAIVGSGLMAERLLPQSAGLQLLANAMATSAMLYVLILIFSEVSGAQFNPLVTFANVADGSTSLSVAVMIVLAQMCGGLTGTVMTHAMFAEPIIQSSTTAREGGSLLLSEVVASFGLIFVILRLRGTSAQQIATAVSLFIFAAYWFTSSTSFANPAVTLARALTDSFSGIAPQSVLPFIGAQIAGGVLAYLCCLILTRK